MSNSLSPADIQRFRLDTDGTQKVIHLNNAGAALPPNSVRDKVIDYLKEEALYGAYEMAAKYHSESQQTYQRIAQLIKGEAEEIALIENATIAWNLAFASISFSQGDIILTTEVEYGSNFINYLKVKKEKGVEIQLIPVDEEGGVDVAALEQMISPAVRLIAITHIPTNGGLVNPAEEIGQIAAKHGILYLLDSCQSIGQLPMDVQKLNCSMLTGTGRKFLRGPRGTGFLYVNKAIIKDLNPPYLDQHSANWVARDRYELHPGAQRFENWESNKGLRLGLSEAVRYAMDIGMDKIWERIQHLATYCREALAEVPGVQLLDRGKQKCGIISFHYGNWEPLQLQKELLDRKINTSVSVKNFTLIDMQNRGLEEVNRLAVHYYNTEEEIDQLVRALLAIKTI